MGERAQHTLAGTIGKVLQADIRSWTSPPPPSTVCSRG
jgi:hypothetical protein